MRASSTPLLAALAAVLALAAYLDRVPVPRRASPPPLCKPTMPEHAHTATHHLLGHQHAHTADHAEHGEHQHSQQHDHDHHVHDDVLPLEFESLTIEIPHLPAEILQEDAFDAPAAESLGEAEKWGG